jgi:lipid II:glycine glycyltransferase (peptidoglycan interpeptide bridge formation enzyme)
VPDFTAENAKTWDRFVAAQPRAHFLQLSAWGTLKQAYGWQFDRVILADREIEVTSGAQLLFRPLPFGLGTMAYLPMGPYFDAAAERDSAAALWDSIHQTAREHGAAFLKWEPGLYLSEPAPDPAALRFRPSAQTIQPPRTIVLDVSDSDDAILARMNQGTRRKIRQSLKHDIHYFEATSADVPMFTQLMQTTGERNDFGVHSADYYAMAHKLFVSKSAALILAEHEGDPLAGIFVFAVGRHAWYVYGASASIKRDLMASYGVQWQAIQWARARGCRTYDLWGIPDADEPTLEAEFEQRSDGLWGVYGFKRGWGGRVVRSLGAWDYVYHPLIYQAYKLALRVRG